MREYTWDPMKWRLPIPPRVADAMDVAQKWAIACTREALEDYGYPKRPLDPDRTAVILGNAMAGEKHYLTVAARVLSRICARTGGNAPASPRCRQALRRDITRELHERIGKRFADITEDTMPGELANCMAGRIANLYNFHGPNYVCDAACASAMAAISSAVEGLVAERFRCGGHRRHRSQHGRSDLREVLQDRRAFGDRHSSLRRGRRRLRDGRRRRHLPAEAAGRCRARRDKIYAVLRGMGGSSDGKGKGITAPNPVGQKFCIERAWENAGLSPATVTLIEGHGTSTRVGDVVEAQSMADVLSSLNLPRAFGGAGLGEVEYRTSERGGGRRRNAEGSSGAARQGAAAQLALRASQSRHRLRALAAVRQHRTEAVGRCRRDGVRRAGVSAFGFGGTNFHAVLEEYIPGRLNGNGKRVDRGDGECRRQQRRMSMTQAVASRVIAVSPRSSAKRRCAERWSSAPLPKRS